MFIILGLHLSTLTLSYVYINLIFRVLSYIYEKYIRLQCLDFEDGLLNYFQVVCTLYVRLGNCKM